MEWVIRFVAIWMVFFFLVNFKELKVNIWCGVFSAVLQVIVDTMFISNRYYTVKHPIIPIWGSSLFLILGPVFVVGILLSQYQPHKKWMQALYVVALSGVYDFEEFLLLVRKELVYIQWTYLTSVVFNFILMGSLSWFAITILRRGGMKKRVLQCMLC